MRVLITGVHGFVGTNLVAYLKEANEIFGLDIVAPQRDGVIKTFSWEDLSKGNIPEVDAIIHLAGKAHDTKNKSAAEAYFAVNTGLTKKIFDYFINSTACKFVFLSTAKAAADRVDGVLTEDVTPTPVGSYGESKIRAEEYILSKELPGGKDVYIFRPCMIHGPGNKGNLNLLYSVVRRGVPWPLGAFENRRTFTSIENMCYAVKGVLTLDVDSGIYNMGDDEALSTNELIEIICQILGKKARIWRLPKGVMTAVARVGGFLHLPLNTERLQKLTENYVSSNAKIKDALGISMFPVSSRDGLRRTLESFVDSSKF